MNNIYSLIMKYKEPIKKVLPMGFLKKCKAAAIDHKLRTYYVPPLHPTAFQKFPSGINLIGDIRVEIGLGQSMRLISDVLDHSNQDYCIINLPLNIDVRRSDHSWDHKLSQEPLYRVNLLHINPQDMAFSCLRLGGSVFKNRYNIGFWLWELEKAPEDAYSTLKLVNEIWTPSEFTSDCFRKITDKPVYTIPYNVAAEADPRYGRSHFGLPEDKFLYLLLFDFNSTLLRKNPQAAIEAFKKAFPPEQQDVGLVIKVNNATSECMETLQDLLDGYNNIYYITKTLDKAEVNSLIGSVDVFVSLHRAEGFGLVMAEAMLLKTACIATNWSSNTEFMNSDTACMVSCTMKQIEEGEGSYPPGAIWADPSVAEAAMYMKKLKENSNFYQNIVEQAYDYASDVLGRERIVAMMEERLSIINDAILSGDLSKLQIPPK